MFIHMLSPDEKKTLIKLASVISLSDNPVLWDGKTTDEPTAATNFDDMRIAESEAEVAILASFKREAGMDDYDFKRLSRHDSLLAAIKQLPVSKQNDMEHRKEICKKEIISIIDGYDVEVFSSSAKIFLFELIELCLAEDGVGGVEKFLLDALAEKLGIDGDIFDDLLAHAQSVNREVRKALYLILE